VFEARTLIIAAKEDCDGCRQLIEAPASAFGPVEVLVVVERASEEPSWRSSAHRVVVSPSLLTALDVRWPPFWVLIDPASGTVLREGVPFGVAHLREAITELL
jgi:hypothetical protein